MKNHIVYIYLDPRKVGKFEYGRHSFEMEPFYVGEGKNGRHADHLREAINNDFPKYANKHKFYRIKSILKENLMPVILILNSNLEKGESRKIEIKLIKDIGRDDLGTGPLLNLTEGGDINPIMFGKSNPMFGKKWNAKRKKDHSKKVIKFYKNLTDEERKKICGRPQSDEMRKYMSDKFSGKGNPRFGVLVSQSTKDKISKKLKGKFIGRNNPNVKKWKITTDKNKMWEVDDGLNVFFESIGFKRVDGEVFRQAYRKRKNGIISKGRFKGWKIEKIT